MKSALLDSVSHDLRTPLASIRAAAGTLADTEVEWPPEKRREIAMSIDREAEWLNRLVTNLLDMSRVEAGELRPNLAVIALPELVSEAIDRTGVATDGRSVTVDVPADLPPVLVDEVLLVRCSPTPWTTRPSTRVPERRSGSLPRSPLGDGFG